MKKICARCGKEKEMLSWETLCYSCMKEKEKERICQEIREGEEEVDTGSSDYIICPYCGNAIDTCYGWEDFPEMYEDGDHSLDCPECEKTFILTTTISYYYETQKQEETK